MPGHGTRKNKKSCGSHGGTRKQRGGLFGVLKSLANKANKNLAAATTAIAEHPIGQKLSKSAAKHITAAQSAARTLAAHPHVQKLSGSVRSNLNAGVNKLRTLHKQAKNKIMTNDLKKKIGVHLGTLQDHVAVAAAHASNAASHIGLHNTAKLATMGGRKKRGHKKRHATKKHGHKKHGHKKHGHKKRHATKKRGHKKRKQRGGKCGCELV